LHKSPPFLVPAEMVSPVTVPYEPLQNLTLYLEFVDKIHGLVDKNDSLVDKLPHFVDKIMILVDKLNILAEKVIDN